MDQRLGLTDVGAENIRATLRAANFGEFMSVLLQSERHRTVTLGMLAEQVVPAFLADQYVIARAVPDNKEAAGTPIGIVFWASVSDEIFQRINSAGSQPVQLAPHEWRSGDRVIILDMVAAPPVRRELLKKVRAKVGVGKPILMMTANSDGRLNLQPVP